MGEIKTHRPVMLIAAITSRYASVIEDWTREKTATAWGPILLESPLFEFTETSFYTASMGNDLKKKFLAYEKLIDPGEIARFKHESNQMEAEFNSGSRGPEDRPLNIDPGYISEAKLVLATTKDRDHRIYLRQGIFAEVTLHLHQGSWRSERWTYPDYQRKDFHEFFSICRERLRGLYRQTKSLES